MRKKLNDVDSITQEIEKLQKKLIKLQFQQQINTDDENE